MVNKNTYLNNWLAEGNRQEIILRNQVRRALNAFVMQYARSYESSVVSVGEDILLRDHRERIQSILEKRYKYIIPRFSKFTLDGFGDDITKAEKDILINTQSQLTQKYIEDNAAKKAIGIADTSIKKIRERVGLGVADGLGISEIASNIRGIQSINAARSVLIARTEVNAAANYGSIETARNAEKEFDIVMEKEWLAVNDSRTRDTHDRADGQVVEVSEKFDINGFEADRPLDDSLPADEVINCLLPDSVVDYASPLSITRRLYDGEVITIKTASGNKITVTSNHPILTARGWLPANLIKKTDKVISSSLRQRKTFANFDVKGRDATIEQVFNSLSSSEDIVRHSGSVVNFHGDATNKNVDIIHVDGFLQNGLESIGLDPFRELKLPHPDFAQGFFFLYSLLYCTGFKKRFRLLLNGFMSFFNLQSSLFVRHLRPLKDFRFTSTSNGNFISSKHSINRGSCNAKHIRNSFGGHSSPVFVDDITDLSISVYSGSVYNLHDEKSYYICNGIVNHNCRCTMLYRRKRD